MAVATIDTGIAQHFKWHLSPDDFEDSPRGPPPVSPFDDTSTSPPLDTFCTYDREYPAATFAAPAPPQLPTLLTSGFAPKVAYAAKPQPQTYVVHSANVPISTSFARQPGFIAKPEACLLATGLSRMGDIPQVNASHRVPQQMHIPLLPLHTSTMHFGDFGVSDPGVELWQERVPLEADTVATRRQMCDYCCVRKAVCFSDCDDNPEIYCDVCQVHGDQRWREHRAEANKKSEEDRDDAISQRGDLDNVVNDFPRTFANPAAASEAFGQGDFEAHDGEPRKKGRSKKSASKKTLERQAKDPTPNPVAPSDWEDGTTTVMMRNIPSRYTVEELVSEMITMNFKDRFDYLYLPMDFKTKRNKGYAFINFVSAQDAVQFHADFHGVQLPKYGTQKTLQIARAETQGLEANLNAAQRDKPRITNPWFRPMVFNAGA